MLTAEVARELLDYNPEDGILRWKNRLNLKSKARSWNKKYAGTEISSKNGHGYLQLSIFKKKYEAHRIIWLIFYGEFPKLNIDHINGIKTDNRISNLREATVAQNAWNLRKPREDGFRGVSIHIQTKKYQSSIRLNGKDIFLGLFETELAAHEAYKAACVKYRGEYTPYA